MEISTEAKVLLAYTATLAAIAAVVIVALTVR